jgi:lipopolysaccharide export LptBFGC system permease protein LptF
LLTTGLLLAVLTAALPLPAWRTPVRMDGPGLDAWTWLDAFWRLGAFALLAIAVSLGILARTGHSRALAVITAVYTVAVCLTGWSDLQQGFILSPFPFAGPAVLLPAAVLLLAGLGALLAGGLRELRR